MELKAIGENILAKYMKALSTLLVKWHSDLRTSYQGLHDPSEITPET